MKSEEHPSISNHRECRFAAQFCLPHVIDSLMLQLFSLLKSPSAWALLQYAGQQAEDAGLLFEQLKSAGALLHSCPTYATRHA